MTSSQHLVPGVQHDLGKTRREGEETRSVQTVLRVIALHKEFRFYRHPWNRILEWCSAGRLQRSQIFTALQNINFEVTEGSALGVIGANGAGKSTLLKIICGTLYPTAGRVELVGRVASLLELGTGFHPDFTGRQNIVFNARFLGLSDEEIRERMAAMVAFSELDNFIDRPLRTYSSGMVLRLAFGVVANVGPQILIIDEALSVGDAYFQQKCIRRIRQFRDEGVTLLFVSHDPGAVKTLCSEALLLHHGRLVDRGQPEEVLASYNTVIAREAGSREILSLEAERATVQGQVRAHRSGSFLAIVEQVRLCDAHGQECRSFLAGEEATITVRVLCIDEVSDPTIGILIRDRLGNDIYGTNTYHYQVQTGVWTGGEVLEASFRLALNLGPGEYSLTVAVHTLDVHLEDCFDWIERLLVFQMLPSLSNRFIGTTFLQPQVTFQRVTEQAGPQVWEPALAQVFGRDFPRALTVASADAPWLFSGWYPPEGTGQDAFRWTHETCIFLLDLRGEHLSFEIGTNRPDAATQPVQVSAWLFDCQLDSVLVDASGSWRLFSLPIPAACQVAHGFIRLQIDGWCPARVGVNTDQRVLGLQVRRIWVAEEPSSR